MSRAAGSLAVDLAAPLLTEGVAVAGADPQLDYPDEPAETVALLRPVAKRLREFKAGRAAARAALRNLIARPGPVPMGEDRAPVWPAGIIGSITHCPTACLAAVAPARRIAHLGLDLEEDAGLEPELHATVCNRRELDWIADQADPPVAARLVFSAKECAYKAQYRHSRTIFGFDGFETEFEAETGRFEAVFTRDIAPFARHFRLPGRYAVSGGLIVTAIANPS